MFEIGINIKVHPPFQYPGFQIGLKIRLNIYPPYVLRNTKDLKSQEIYG